MLRKKNTLFTAKSIGSDIRNISKTIYRKYGFFQADIILEWKNIVGEEWAELCTPIKIAGSEFSGYSLYIATPKSVATQMVYVIPNILERISKYFGFSAIQNIKFVQNYKKNKKKIEIFSESSANNNVKNEKRVVKGEKGSLGVEIGYEPLEEALLNWQSAINKTLRTDCF